MEDLSRSSKAAGSLGEPIPTVFPALANIGAHIRRGTYTLISAAPGRGKSLLALTLVIRTGLRTLYLSPDCNVADTMLRASAMLSGDALDTVEDAFKHREGGHYEDLVDHIMRPRVRFVWESPTLDEINAELSAFAVAFGDYPELVIVDNVSDIYAAADEWQSLRLTSDYLKSLAHSTGAAIVGLHHLEGPYDDGTASPPITAIRGKITKKPEQVWTLWGSAQGQVLKVNVVKNRGGKANTAGHITADLRVNYEKAEIV